MSAGGHPSPGGGNRIHLVADDIEVTDAFADLEGFTAFTAGQGDGCFIDQTSLNTTDHWRPPMIHPGIDHIALTVPDLDAQIERLTTTLGLVIVNRFGDFALMSDPSTGVRLELGRSDDDQVHFRHFGCRTDDVDSAHQHLVSTGMDTDELPHRRDFAAMYTSFLHEDGCADLQLVRYDQD